MIFTIIDDGRASLICNDCISFGQLESGYAETEVGCCDECGLRGANLWPSQAPAIIIGLSMMFVEQWAHDHDLYAKNNVLVATDSIDPARLEGIKIDPSRVALLPGAERGRSWLEIERRLAGHTDGLLFGGTITGAKLHTHSITTNNTTTLNLQHYNKLLYGYDPGVRSGVGVFGVTS